jgi:NADH-quinone oxidoreductase subunit J
MTGLQAVFLLAAATILFSAYMVVTRNNLIHAALFLVLGLFGVAVLFVLLEAGFLAVIQILVYIGAIAILMIFAVMLTRGDVENLPSPNNANSGWIALLSVLFFSSLVLLISSWPEFNAVRPYIDPTRDTVVELGVALVSPEAFVIPFEVASVLLLAAMIGAIMIARPQKKDKS